MTNLSSSIFWVDCQYIRPQFAAAYIVKNGPYAAIVETGTKHNVKAILDELKTLQIERENVLYIIPTHVHLDHAAAAGYLAAELPNAKVLAHPRGKTHLANPQRLKEGSISVYGQENFDKLFGDILPIAEERLLLAGHEGELPLGQDVLRFYHCPGHASHHFAVWVNSVQVLFSGDTFGIGYPELQPSEGDFVFPSATPIDFNAKQAIESADLFLSLKPKAVALTHFGIYSDVEEIGLELKEDLRMFEAWVTEAVSLQGQEEMQEFMRQKLQTYFQEKFRQKEIDKSKFLLVENDILLNAAGLAVAAARLKKKNSKK